MVASDDTRAAQNATQIENNEHLQLAGAE